MNPKTGRVVVDDGTEIEYDLYDDGQPPEAPWLVLLHGWSGSRRAFDRAIPYLAPHCRVLAPDLRHHGGSGRTPHGRHVARLAADLRDVLAALGVDGATLVGTSMGSAVIWSYFELFAGARAAKAVFVDQAPLQNRAPDWQLGSRGCYDEASLGALRDTLLDDLGAIADGNEAGCLALPVPDDTRAALRAATLSCDGAALAELMRDHTQLDWRSLLPRLGTKAPCLVLAGAKSGVFPVEGCLEAARLAGANARAVVFDSASHWLYVEQPEQFAKVVVDFVRGDAGDEAAVVSHVA